MIRSISVIIFATLFVFASTADARETRVELPLQELVNSDAARAAGIDGSVRFYLAGQSPNVLSRMGEAISNRKTNAANKSDVKACRWVALSVLKDFQDSARERGANAVVDIVSYYKKREFRSATTYECYAGALIAGMALKGTYAKVQ